MVFVDEFKSYYRFLDSVRRTLVWMQPVFQVRMTSPGEFATADVLMYIMATDEMTLQMAAKLQTT